MNSPESYRNWYGVSIEDYYDPHTCCYRLPKEIVSDGLKKVITNNLQEHFKKLYRFCLKTATTHEGIQSYTKEKWGQDKTVKVPIDKVIQIMIESTNPFLERERNFTDNIKRQGWISFKQFRVLESFVFHRDGINSRWETDDDELLYDHFDDINN